MGKFVLRDTYFQKAKKEGFRARSAYKLLEIQKKFNILKKGDRVLDLGTAPGGFVQVISKVVGNEGFVIGIDVLETKPFPEKNIVVKKADIVNVDLPAIMQNYGVSFFDVITCDISPNISGIRDVDERRRREVYEAVKGIVRLCLRQGGNLVMKCFSTQSFTIVKADLSTMFKSVKPFKPQASRKTSSELYLVCLRKL